MTGEVYLSCFWHAVCRCPESTANCKRLRWVASVVFLAVWPFLWTAVYIFWFCRIRSVGGPVRAGLSHCLENKESSMNGTELGQRKF